MPFCLWPDTLPLTCQLSYSVFLSDGHPVYLLLSYKWASLCLVKCVFEKAFLSEELAGPQSDPAGGTSLNHC